MLLYYSSNNSRGLEWEWIKEKVIVGALFGNTTNEIAYNSRILILSSCLLLNKTSSFKM